MPDAQLLAPHVSSTPGIRGGEPCLTGTRIPTDILLWRFTAGETVAELAADYEQSPERIEAALRFQMRRRKK